MKTKSILTQQRDEYFVKQFQKLFGAWKAKDKSHTQGEFARLICKIRKAKTGEKCPVTNSYVSEWLRGKWFPEMYLPEIAEVLGVDTEDFFPSTREELYENSSLHMNKFRNEEILPFCEKIGLDVSFIDAIRKQVDFEKLFPLFVPAMINPDANGFIDGKYYTLSPEYFLANSAPMDDDTFQVKREFDCLYNEKGEIEPMESLITLSKADLLFLRDVQKDVARYIEFLFMKRREEMQDEVDRMNEASKKQLPDGGRAHVRLTRKQVCEIAPYYKAFNDSEE